jgi:predicted RNA-binding protein with PUA-like domain
MQAMRKGQSAFFYQSACKTPGVVGIVEIEKEAYPDDTQFDSKSRYHDAKAAKDTPKWFMVDIKLVCNLPC